MASAFTRLVTSALFGAIAVMPHPAQCQEESPRLAECTAGAADAHFSVGLEQAEKGQHLRAVEAFEAAYRCQPHYAVLYNISQSYVHLGDYAKALTTLQRFLSEGSPHVSEDTMREVREQIEQLRAAISETQASSPSPPPAGDGVGTVAAAPEPSPSGPSPSEPSPPQAQPPPSAGATKMPVATRPSSPAPDQQQPRVGGTPALALAGVGTLTGAAAIGLYVWNEGRYATWQQTDGELAEARDDMLTTAEAEHLSRRQRDNNQRLKSVKYVGALNVGLGLVSLASLLGGLYFALDVPGTEATTVTWTPGQVFIVGQW